MPLVLEHLRSAEPIDWRSAVVIAHPDDEILSMGSRLAIFRRLVIIQLTDGSPQDGRDAARLGFAERAHYAAKREQEAQRALGVLGLSCRRVCLGATDCDSICQFSALLARLKDELRGARLLFTHPYEGGHPDHDTAALLVQLACDGIASSQGVAPERLEFASYHHRNGSLVTGEFWPEPDLPEMRVVVDGLAHELKRRALAEHATQASVVARFNTGEERYRLAPRYDFSQAPPPGLSQYDLFGWDMTSSRWREKAAAMLASCAEIVR